jgi:hypothetical protein
VGHHRVGRTGALAGRDGRAFYQAQGHGRQAMHIVSHEAGDGSRQIRPPSPMGSIGLVRLFGFEQAGQPVLGVQLFALHLREGNVIEWQHAEFGVEYLFIQLAMAVVELAEFDIGFQHCVQLIARLTFEHGA